MSETLKQMALRIAQETLDKLGWGAAFNPLLYGVTFSDGEQFKSFIDEFARRLRAEWGAEQQLNASRYQCPHCNAEQQKQEPVAEVVKNYFDGEKWTRRFAYIKEMPPIGTLLYAAPPQDAQDVKRYRARRAEIYQMRLRTEIPGYRNWKPTTVEEFNAEYDAACDKQIREQDAAMRGKGEGT